MNPKVHLIWPDGLAVWFFLRIFKPWIWNLGAVLGSIPSQALFSFSLLGESFTNEKNRPEVVYNCWGRCLPTIFGNITRSSHLYQHQSTQLKFGDATSSFGFPDHLRLVWSILNDGQIKWGIYKSCVDWSYRVIFPKKVVGTAPNSCKEPPSPESILLLCEHNSNTTHTRNSEKKGPDWELNPGPLPNSNFLGKDHATRPSGHIIERMFGLIFSNYKDKIIWQVCCSKSYDIGARRITI